MSDETIEELREACYITSVDGCCHCGDCECDGIGCIAALDADDSADHDAIDALHGMLRAGQAWQAMHRVIEAGAPLSTAYDLAAETLAYAENREGPRLALFASAPPAAPETEGGQPG